MRFDRKKFFEGYRAAFGSLRKDHVENLEFLLGKFEQSRWFSADVRRPSFALGNLYIETFVPKTGSRFAPVTEFGPKSYFNRYDIAHNPRKAKDLGNLSPGDGYRYRGRGFCQITGKTNYAKFEIADDPDKALDPETAFYILERGIRYGIFTSKSLDLYITAGKTDYVNARRVINGQDRAKEIAGYARSFEKILNSAAVPAEEPAHTPVESAATGEKLADESNSANQPPPIIQNADQIINTGDSNTPPTDAKAKVSAPEPYLGVGFWAVIKRDLAAATGGNLGFESLAQYAQQASGWPEWVVGIISKVAVGVLIATIGYFIFRAIHYGVDTWKKNQKTKMEVDANTDQSRKDIKWV
jgi:putative chitinase